MIQQKKTQLVSFFEVLNYLIHIF